MQGRDIMSQMRGRFSECASYHDSGSMEWKVGDNLKGTLKFETFFERPYLLRFAWTGFFYAQRGSDYKAESDLQTVIGLWSNQAYRWDPRFSDFCGLEVQPSIREALLNDSAFSNRITRFAVSMLSSEFCWFEQDPSFDCVLWRYGTIEQRPCYVLRCSDLFSEQILWIDRQTYCLRRCQIAYRRGNNVPKPEQDLELDYDAAIFSSPGRITQLRHADTYNFHAPTFNESLSKSIFDPSINLQ